jgi:hypothetical protein
VNTRLLIFPLYWPSETVSIQSTTLPLRASWIAICVVATLAYIVSRH